ncbi:hypothetical protein CHGG_02701 [Chaetomium globosum CBS 148.51]|uniref:DNA 3'-5' helicase n=1 Tax=Chaetomium globosum (strain ATCC 6205 / CBS 148.51 / DSM 1962 / NBRC 6347 / NRRL 1970) TaxID=306901 RepID=Q2HAQ3_CHAGB|nr:uncharacterized protein CHGG_02701 [Chaetomium globosum CBS 148.51]EAQ90766.1 hypothetical protein CHGG_02701 [Chaetomium globosum CBS 148.51]
MDVFDDIERVPATLRTLAGGHEPRRGQIEAVKSLAIYQQDTILVAATGYGKSAVLFAFSAIKPDRITVQIVPLVTLGESQRQGIATKLPESRPIWVDADTHLKEVEDRKYSHVLLSPEQALNPKFKAILRDPAFHTKIGLFAIDELHCVGEWRHFKEDYTYLYTLRTLDRDNQGYILKHAGFNPYPSIIRTSIDRPEISIIVQPLLRGSIYDYRRLQFPVEGSSAGFARKVVRRFDADVRPTDKEIIFKDFTNLDTNCRIIVATVSLGMGMDIPDVRPVIQFGIPPSTSIADIWQRIRRAVRKQPVDGRVQGIAYLFILYWAFDHLGSVEKQKPAARKRPQPRRAQRQPNAAVVSSRLQLMTLVDDESDNDAGGHASAVTQASQDTIVSESQAPAVPEELTLEATISSQCLFDFTTKGEKPSTGSLAGHALKHISSWCIKNARNLV